MFDSELRRLADAGSAEHQWQLSQTYREAKQAARASRYFRRALDQGYPAAVIQQVQEWTSVPGEHGNFAKALTLLDQYPELEGLAMWRWQVKIVSGVMAPEEDARTTWELVCERYTPALRYAAVRFAVAGHIPEALKLLCIAREAGDELSRELLENHIADLDQNVCNSAALDMSLQDFSALFESGTFAPASELAGDPAITLYRGWLPALVCCLLRLIAEPELRPSLAYEPGTGRQVESSLRTSYSMIFMPWLMDPSIAYIQRRLASFCEMQPFQSEVLGILRYQPGQAYQLHYDAFGEDQTNVEALLQDGGQRIKTALIYLNGGYSGGETRMENLDLEVKGEEGDLLVFDNVDRQGMRHKDSLHAGMPVIEGTKWLLSQWYRQQETLYTRQMNWREKGKQ